MDIYAMGLCLLIITLYYKNFLTNHLNKIYIIIKKYLKNVLKCFENVLKCLKMFILIIQYYRFK